MKVSTIIAAALIFLASLYCSKAFAQSSGIAADKQKQENLEKNKARQKEMQKKYNSLSPEEAAAAEKRANEYKKSGGKTATGKGTSTKPATKPATPATPAKPAASNSKSTSTKPAAKNTTTKPAPVFMDANGKPLNKTTAPTKPSATSPTKNTSKTSAPKTTTPAPDAASEKVKK